MSFQKMPVQWHRIMTAGFQYFFILKIIKQITIIFFKYLSEGDYNRLLLPNRPFMSPWPFAEIPLLFQPPPLSQFWYLSETPLLFTTPFYSVLRSKIFFFDLDSLKKYSENLENRVGNFLLSLTFVIRHNADFLSTWV